jgi:hypothetical protein
MLTPNQLERELSHLPEKYREVVLEIHNIVLSACSTADLRFHRQGISYFDPIRGGTVKAGICQVLTDGGHLRLAFIHGAFLPDPLHLLMGERLYKKFVTLQDYDSTPWDAVTRLIQASAAFRPEMGFSVKRSPD